VGLQEEELVVVADGHAVRETAPHDLPVDHSRDVFSIPNVITVLRLVLIPFFYWFLVYGAPHTGPNHAAFLFFTISAATDWLDGLIARRTGAVTAIGKVIDPIVDRLLIASAVIGLYVVGRVGLPLMLVLIGRDVYLLYGAWVLERHGRRLPVSMIGKVTTAVLLSGFASLIWDFPLLAGRPLGAYIVYAGVALSLTAAVLYTITARRVYREATTEEHAVAEAASSDEGDTR
jgi:cardiolipin synthase